VRFMNADLDSLGDIMLSRAHEIAYFDSWTGQPEFLSHAQIRAFLHKEKAPLDSLSIDEQDNFFMVERIFSDTERRYLDLPRISEDEEVSWMREFVDRISKIDLSQKLRFILRKDIRSVATLKFEAELFRTSFPDWKKWIDFRNKKKRRTVNKILHDLDSHRNGAKER
jgi:hypothetical protein